jgi:hypothetical protein
VSCAGCDASGIFSCESGELLWDPFMKRFMMLTRPAWVLSLLCVLIMLRCDGSWPQASTPQFEIQFVVYLVGAVESDKFSTMKYPCLLLKHTVKVAGI